MGSREKFEHWLDIAQYDLRVAETMLAGRHWLYVTFMCQQAVEKLVKGLYTLYVSDDVPRTHNIRVLFGYFSSQLPVAVPDATLDFFEALAGYYTNNRYPDFKEKLSSFIQRKEAHATLRQTKEVFAWLLTMKPSNRS